MDAQLVKLSKFLSLVLRHEPGRIGIELDAAGWTDVQQLLTACRAHGVAMSREQLQEVVQTNDKKRFAFSPDGQRIRAQQGHSVEVKLGYAPESPPDILYHGTAERSVASIRSQGLTRRGRTHVHLSATPETAAKVGQRHGKPVILVIGSGRMHADGRAFFLTPNGVWLTEAVPPEYIEFPAR